MEAVRAFNNELSSLYETRPPVSRAKMASVTKSAIKAIKFYKHVVQSVEKFVMKCKPEYKIPGLYVVDSIVRQSRHQFGSEKDVFGPRFTKNIVTTFQSLLKCPPDEKCRVIRVLNLWQKNAVFPMEVIQPLLDMAANPTNTDSVLAAYRHFDGSLAPYLSSSLSVQKSSRTLQSSSSRRHEVPRRRLKSVAQRAVEKVVQAHQRSLGKASNGGTEESLLAQQSDIVNTVTKLLQQTGEGSLLASGQEVQLQQLQLLQQQLVMHTEMMSSKPQQTPPVIDNNLLAQIKLLTDQLLSKTDTPSGGPPSSQPPVAVPPVPPHNMNEGVPPIPEHRKQPELGFNRKLLDFDYGDSDEEDERKDGPGMHPHPLPGGVQKLLNDPSLMQHIHNVSNLQSDQLRQDMQDPDAMRKHHLEQQQEQFNKEIGQSQYSNYNQDPDVIVVEDQDDRDSRDFDRDRRRSRRSRERSRSRSPRRRRHSRSRSRERRRSRDRHRRSRSRDMERERQREKDRDRKKKGLPPIKEKHISICSTTLWFGHLAKHTTEDELRAAIENYGPTETIKMVPPRGCAYVSMTWRRDAAKALDRMKGFKLNSSALRVAWAPNIGVKESHFNDLWDAELGVTYIPWNKMPADLTPLLNGAVIDDETLPDHLKGSVSGRPEEDSDMRPSQPVDNHIAPPPVNQQMPNYSSHNQPIPSSQQMTMIPPPMMMPPPGHQMPPGVGMPPPPNVNQMPMPGQMMPGQGNHQQMPPNLLPPPGSQVSTAMSLPGGVSLPQVVSAAVSLQGGGPPNMLNSPAPAITMERPPGMPLSCSSPLVMPGQQQGILSRPGFAPQGSPFGLHGLRPGFQLTPGQGLRPPFPMEEPKEWPSDDKLEEEALAEMEDEDTDQRLDLPAPGPGPTLMSLSTMMGMRMRLPGHGGPGGGPPRMPIQMPGGSPRPGMMVDMGQPISSTGMPLGGMMGRPGMMGPRVLPPGSGAPGPQDGPEGLVGRPPMPQGMMAQGGLGMRMGMGGQGPRGLNPGGMPLGPRALGMPGSPGLRGLGPGQGPIRIVLGQRPNLVRPGGPFGFDTPPHPRLQPLGDGGPPNQHDRNPLDDGPPGPGPGPGPNPNNGPQGPGLLPGLMMGAALRGGRPGLLGARPNLPVNGGFRFGPGGLSFRGPRPDFLRGPAMDNKPVVMEGSQGSMPGPFAGGLPLRGNNSSPQYGEGENSPEYGEEFVEKDNTKVAAAQDMDLRGDTDLRADTDLRPQDTDLRGNSGGVGADSDARRLTRWGSGEGESANPASQDGLTNTNGLTPKADSLPAASQDSLGAASNANQTAPDALEGASEG